MASVEHDGWAMNWWKGSGDNAGETFLGRKCYHHYETQTDVRLPGLTKELFLNYISMYPHRNRNKYYRKMWNVCREIESRGRREGWEITETIQHRKEIFKTAIFSDRHIKILLQYFISRWWTLATASGGCWTNYLDSLSHTNEMDLPSIKHCVLLINIAMNKTYNKSESQVSYGVCAPLSLSPSWRLALVLLKESSLWS